MRKIALNTENSKKHHISTKIAIYGNRNGIRKSENNPYPL
jgi:hypothetical protein